MGEVVTDFSVLGKIGDVDVTSPTAANSVGNVASPASSDSKVEPQCTDKEGSPEPEAPKVWRTSSPHRQQGKPSPVVAQDRTSSKPGDDAMSVLLTSQEDLCDHKTCGLLEKSEDDEIDEPSTCPVHDQFQQLQEALLQCRLPPTVDRTSQPRTSHTENDVTIVVIGEVEEGLPPVLEGNRQYKAGALLVLTTSWLSIEPSPREEGLNSVLVHKAISADAGGQTWLDVFSPPRRATYIINQLTTPVTYGRRKEGDVVEDWNVDCPRSGSLLLNHRIDNKLLTRIACTEVGIVVPVTLALWVEGDMSEAEDLGENIPSYIKVMRLATQDVSYNWLEPHILRFINSDKMQPYAKVVVKPFGPMWYGCKKVSIHTKTQTYTIIKAILDIMSEVEPGDGVLIESFVETMEPLVSPYIGRHAVNIERIDLGLRARVIVSRTPQNGAHVTQILCGVGDGRKPVAGTSTVPITLELMLTKWGIPDKDQQRDIRSVIKNGAEKLMLKLIEQETKLTDKEKGGRTAQTETIGIDYLFTRRKHTITPVVIEVNAQDCLWVSSVYEWMNPFMRGTSVRTWVQTAIARSQQYLMTGKKLLVIGAGGYSKRRLWKDSKDYGVKVVLVDSVPNHFAREEVFKFLHYDFTDHTEDERHADEIAKRINEEVGTIDGCLAIWEDCFPLVALVAVRLGVKHTCSIESALAIKDKMLTMRTLSEDKAETAVSFAPALFASSASLIESPEDVPAAVEQVALPAVLKLQYGTNAVAARHVSDVEEAVAHVEQVQSILKTEKDYPGVGLGHGTSFMLMTRLNGTEHDIDIVMFEGLVMAAFVSDNGPTHVPLCFETCAAMPTMLDKEEERTLIGAAESCCRSLGLLTGVYNVEMIMTPRGPRLIEINTYMGGFYIREWIKRIYHVDLFHLSMLAACGVRPIAANSPMSGYNCVKARENVGQLMGLMLYPSRHEKALATTACIDHLTRMDREGAILYLQQDRDPEKAEESSLEEPFASLSVHGPTLEAARAKLVGTVQALGLETDETLDYLLQDFVLV